jgi:hypothetical protein
MRFTSQKTGNCIVKIVEVEVALEEAIKTQKVKRGIVVLFLLPRR